MNRVIQTINPDGGSSSVNYDLAGYQVATTDPLGNSTSYAYDSLGRLIQTAYPNSTTNSSAYDANGNRTNSVDQAGRVTGYIYDALNRLVQTTYADATTNATVYDGVGRVAQTIDARGTITGFAYDVAGRRLAVTNAFNTAVTQTNYYGYDANGNQTTFEDALGRVTTTVFDALNRPVQTIYPDLTTSEVVYDAGGRRVAQTNQDGIATWYGYDGSGRLTCVTNALKQVTRYQYDEAGNETAQIDALNRTNNYAYDGLGRRIQHSLPGGQAETFGYDWNGNLLYHTNFNGATITNQYDVLNRLTAKLYPNATSNTFSYTPTGQRATMNDASGSSRSIYDLRDRVRTNATPQGTLFYGYDANGNVASISSSTANGTLVSYQYDALNRLTNVLDSRLAGTQSTAYGFDLVGNLQHAQYPNAMTNLYQYDSLNRLTSLVWKTNGTTLGSFAYQLGATGNRTNLSETVGAGASARGYAWQYDALYRLTNEAVSAVAPTGNLGYGYDAVGNRTSRTGTLASLGAQSLAYTTNDWLSTYVYDSNGNTRTNASNQPYVYDYENRLTNFNHGEVILVYDGDGNRVKKVTGTSTNFYLVDAHNPSGYAQVLEEVSISGGTTNLLRAYTYGLGLISQRVPGGSTNFLVADGHGSTRVLTDAGGSTVNVFGFDGYGNLIASNGPAQTAYLYCGQQLDSDLGLYYNRARYLDVSMGRFWTMDTYEGDNEDPLSLHKYLYVKDNPVNKSDPSGQDGIDDILTIADAIGTFGATVSAPAIGSVTGTGGPDVTKALNRTLLDVQAKFWSWSSDQKNDAAQRMRDLFGAATRRGAGGRGGAADAWDIIPLMEVGFDVNYGYLIADGQSYRAGTGMWTRTVGFNGKCYYASAVNYALWGTMNRCVYDWLSFDDRQDNLNRDEYTLDVAIHTMQAFKHFSYHDFGPIEKEAAEFTAYGYNGTQPSWALPCKPTGTVTAKMFNWCWEPVQPRQ
jgi:RHS repeat-associated protein